VLAKAGTRIDTVDLRYRNGFAARVPGFRERPPKRVAEARELETGAQAARRDASSGAVKRSVPAAAHRNHEAGA